MDIKGEVIDEHKFRFYWVRIKSEEEGYRYADILQRLDDAAENIKNDTNVTKIIAKHKDTIVAAVPIDKRNAVFIGCVISNLGELSFTMYDSVKDKIIDLTPKKIERLFKTKTIFRNIISRIMNRAKEMIEGLNGKAYPTLPSAKFIRAWKEARDSNALPEYYSIESLHLTEGIDSRERLEDWVKEVEKKGFLNMTSEEKDVYYREKARLYKQYRDEDLPKSINRNIISSAER